METIKKLMLLGFLGATLAGNVFGAGSEEQPLPQDVLFWEFMPCAKSLPKLREAWGVRQVKEQDWDEVPQIRETLSKIKPNDMDDGWVTYFWGSDGVLDTVERPGAKAVWKVRKFLSENFFSMEDLVSDRDIKVFGDFDYYKISSDGLYLVAKRFASRDRMGNVRPKEDIAWRIADEDDIGCRRTVLSALLAGAEMFRQERLASEWKEEMERQAALGE